MLNWDETYCELSSLWILLSSRMCRFLTRSNWSSSAWISASSCIQVQRFITYLIVWTGDSKRKKEKKVGKTTTKAKRNIGTFLRWPIRSLKISSCSRYSASDNLWEIREPEMHYYINKILKTESKENVRFYWRKYVKCLNNCDLQS